MIFGPDLFYSLKKNEEEEGENEEEFRDFSMVIGKDLKEIKSSNSDLNLSKSSFRIKSNTKTSLTKRNSVKKLAPIKGKTLGKIVAKEVKKPPVDLRQHFMKKFREENSINKINEVKTRAQTPQKKIFIIPFQMFNIIQSDDPTKIEPVKPNLINILERWKRKISKIIFITFTQNSDLSQNLGKKEAEIKILIQEKEDKNFKIFFDKISKIKELNRSCFSLYKMLKDTEKILDLISKVLSEENSKKKLKEIQVLFEGINNSIDRMTFSSAFKMVINSLKSDKEILKENEYLNYIFIQMFISGSDKLKEIFLMSKLSFKLILSKKNFELLNKHCDFWLKLAKTNLYYMASLQKNFTLKFFSEFFNEELKGLKSFMIKITEFCNLMLRLVEFMLKEEEELDVKKKMIKDVILTIPKGIDVFDEKNIHIWDTIVVKNKLMILTFLRFL